MENNKNKKHEIEIVYDENRDWLFTVETKNGEKESFIISHNKAGTNSWIVFWADCDDFKLLESKIKQDAEIEILENDSHFGVFKCFEEFKYIRQGCEFSLRYVSFVDVWIDPWWDGEPFIEFGFVNKGHPDFEVYASEALRINNLLFQGRQKKKEK